MTVQDLTLEEATEAIRRCAFSERDDDGNEVRSIVHCFLGSFGCDWDADGAVGLLPDAKRICFTDHWLWGRCLVVESADGRTYCFDTVTPEPS